MKVKIGNKIHDAEEEPILVILTESDKHNIANLPANAPGYLVFPEGTDEDQLTTWAREGMSAAGVLLGEISQEAGQ
jgi:hypothetical protein